jgi:predicted nucleic acid-binding protein
LILYLDTSAWLKLYVAERGTQEVIAAVQSAELVAISRIAYAETRAALARVLREKRTTQAEHRKRIAALDADYAEVLKVEVSEEVVRQAGELAEAHALRGFDAIQLASARWLARKTRKPLRLLAFDDRMHKAAHALGLA